MKLNDYLSSLPSKRKLSEVKVKILTRLWGDNDTPFPKQWVLSSELLELTGQKYFDRRARELRDSLGCDLESKYLAEFKGQAWRIKSPNLAQPQDREYLTQSQKNKLFKDNKMTCAICGKISSAGVRGLQADHKIPLSRGGGNELSNWQPVCHTCNIGKRRACEKCTMDCNTCAWAFPEKRYSVYIELEKSEYDRISMIAAKDGISINQLIKKSITKLRN